MPERPRLLVVAIDFPPAIGGIQHYMLRLAQELSPRWDVRVVAPAADGAAAHDRGLGLPVTRTRLPWRGAARPAVLAEMAALTRLSDADVVVAGHLAAAPAVVWGANARPVVAMAYGSELWSAAVRRGLGWAGPRLAALVAISRFTADEAVAAGIPAGSIRIVAPGADLLERPAGEGRLLAGLGLVGADGRTRPFLLTVARLAGAYKGHADLLRALPAICARHPEARMVMAGGGPMAASVADMAGQLDVRDAVVLTGPVDERTKAALIHGCRALAMISRVSPAEGHFEGFGIVYLEAALAGRPAIASREGGSADAVVDGVTGLLVDPTRPAEVAEAALALLDDPAHADALGARARERAEAEFTWPAIAARIDGVLREAAGRYAAASIRT